jgi:Na+(H+)/acetate symporter ActP
MLFGKNHTKTYLIFSAIAIGLILDESLFVMAKIRGPTTYAETLLSTQTLVAIIIIIIGIILFDFIGRMKQK